MILSYRDKRTRRFAEGEFVKAFQGFDQQAARRLAILNAAPLLARDVHPGEILQQELEELGISPTELSRQIAVPSNRIGQIIAGKRSITGDTALRLGRWFGVDPQFWLNLQAQYDLAIAERRCGGAIAHLPTRPQIVGGGTAPAFSSGQP